MPLCAHSRTSTLRSRSQGFTLVELLITVVVFAILAALVAPNLRAFLTRSTVSAQTNELIAALRLARVEAVKRGENVEVLAIGADFSNGWTVQVVSDAEVIERRENPDVSYRVLALATGAADSTRVAFRPTGALQDATQFDFSICMPTDTPLADRTRHSRRIQIFQAGTLQSRTGTLGAPAGACT